MTWASHYLDLLASNVINVSPVGYNIHITTTKEGGSMSANAYSVQSLLVGKMYYSNSVKGEIISAEKNYDVFYTNADTYKVQIRPTNSIKDTYRYVAVNVGE